VEDVSSERPIRGRAVAMIDHWTDVDQACLLIFGEHPDAGDDGDIDSLPHRDA
jgi:hypothetical protein